MSVATATDVKVDALRAQLPAVQETGYFNTGSNGPMPTVAFAAAEEAARHELERGRIVPGTYEGNRKRNRRVAQLAAEIFGADHDEIVSTTEEHPGLLLPLGMLGYRHGVVTRFANLGDGENDVVEAIAAKITSRTRAIALSHVLWSTGVVLPLRDIADLAAENELLLIVDGAQSGGQVPVDFHALGVDAYAMAGQKWLCGPEATGLLYIRRERFADIKPTYVRYGQYEPSGFFIPAAGAMRYEIGEFYSPAIAAQAAVLTWIRDEAEFDWAYARIAALGALFRSRLIDIDGVSIITPAENMAGLVNFNIAGMRPQDVTAQLYERGYTIRYVDYAPCTVSARASVGWWNTEAEVAGLAGAIAALADEALRKGD